MKPTPAAIEAAARALLPCPFCGEKRIYINPPDPALGSKGSINCPACLATMPREVNSDEEMISSWNVRVLPDLGDMVLVPREPTEDMIYAARDAFRKTRVSGVCGQTIEACFANEYAREFAMYRAMIAAAQED